MAGQDGASSIQACALRMARLAADGSTPAGATNMIVTNALIKLDLKGVYEGGAELTQVNGCGNIAVAYKDVDKFKRYDATLSIATHDAEAAEMLTGGSLITSGGSTIGFSIPKVGAGTPVGVSLELWSKAWVNNSPPAGVTFTDAATTSSGTGLTSATANFSTADQGRTITGAGIPANTTIATVTNSTTIVLSAAATATATGVSITIGRPGAYIRHVFQKFQAVLDDFSLENALKVVMFKGPIMENPNIGNGPSNDFPAGYVAASSGAYAWWRDTAVPSTSIGYVATPTQV